MGRKFGSVDSYKRNNENYRGRLLGAKDRQRRDGFAHWLINEDERLKKLESSLSDHSKLFWRIEYLSQLIGWKVPSSKRYRFRLPKYYYLQTSIIDASLRLAFGKNYLRYLKRLIELGYHDPLTPEDIIDIGKNNKRARLFKETVEKELKELIQKLKCEKASN